MSIFLKVFHLTFLDVVVFLYTVHHMFLLEINILKEKIKFDNHLFCLRHFYISSYIKVFNSLSGLFIFNS